MPNAEVQADKAWLTTDDNPFNPFTQWDEWYEYDEDHHYCTTEYIARMAMLSDNMTDEEESQAILDALKNIIKFDIFSQYRIIYDK